MNAPESQLSQMHERIIAFQKKSAYDEAEREIKLLHDAATKMAESRKKGRNWAMSLEDPKFFQWLAEAKCARINRGSGEGARGDGWDRALDKLRILGIADDEREDFANAAIDTYEEAEI